MESYPTKMPMKRRLFLCLLLSISVTTSADEPIRVVNHQDGSTIRYPVPLLRGVLGGESLDRMTITNTSSDRDTRRLEAVVHKGRFKGLAELVPGRNELLLAAGKHEKRFVLHYRPQTNPYVVRIIYHTDKSGQTDYMTQLDDDPQNYAEKLDTAMKLMQTFTAERMADMGFGRVTFNLELDDRGKVIVHTVKGDHPAEHYYGMKGNQWFDHLRRSLEKEFSYETGINVVLPAYTRFDPETKRLRGHTALGGGAMALFGSGGLFTWPNNLADVARAFGDARTMDPEKVCDDSAGRRALWANAATGIGATLHETAHGLGIFHCRDGGDIMTRAFDHFARAFVFVDAPCSRNREPYEFPDDQIARFNAVSATALVATRWFSLDDRAYEPAKEIKVRIDEKHDRIEFAVGHGIRFIGFDRGVMTVAFHAFLDAPDPPKQLGFDLKEIRKATGAERVRVRVIDSQGYILMQDVRIPAEPETD